MSAQKEIARAEAVAWFARLHNDDATEQNWLDFETWLANPVNKAAFEAVETTMSGIDAERVAISEGLQQRDGMRPRLRVSAPLWATGAAVAVALAFAFVSSLPEKVDELTFAASSSGPQTATLADRTLVHLNRGAVLHVRMSKHARQTILERGEASFVVAHDVSRPFSVAVGEVTITDIGTEFDVVRAPTYTTVTVREGQVALHSAHAPEARLVAGQQARVEDSAVTVAAANPNDAFGWHSGRLIYHDAPLSRIVEDLNRYSQTPISIADERARALRFSGVLVIAEPASMVRRLEAFLPVQSAQNADGIVLRSRP